MSNFKKVLASTAAFAAMIALAAPANADITVTGTQNFIATGAAPPAATVFSTGATVTIDNAVLTTTGGGTAPVLALGNIVTVSLPAGTTFATEPTFTPTLAGGTTATKVAGGNGTGFYSFSIGGNAYTTGNVTLTGVNVQGVSSAANGASVRLTLSDQAGLVVPGAGGSAAISLANFRNLYTFETVGQGGASAATTTAQIGTSRSVTTGVVNNSISISGTSPGTTFAAAAVTNAQSSTSTARLGVLNIERNANIVNWGGASVVAGAATVEVTLPAGAPPFGTPTAALTGTGCTGGTLSVSAFTGTKYTVSIPAASLTGVAATGGTCALALTAPLAASNTTFISRGAASLTGSFASTNGPTGSSPQGASGNLSGFDYTGGVDHTLGYVNGSDSSYQTFVSVSTAGSSGPIIVNANVGGAAGSAVVTTSQAANTNVLYPVASGTNSIRDALIDAGMSNTVFATGNSRGQVTVVAPTGARVALLLLSPNGTVTEVGRTSANN